MDLLSLIEKLMDDGCCRNPANKLLVERLLETNIGLDKKAAVPIKAPSQDEL